MNVFPIQIRDMTGADLDRICLIEQLAGDVHWTRAQFEKELTLTHSHFVVALQNDIVVGYTGFWAVYGEAQVMTIVVHPDFQCRGIGRQLLENLCQRAKVQNCERVTLEVRLQNVHAQQLYEKMNFKRQTIRPNVYTDPIDDAVLMEKIL